MLLYVHTQHRILRFDHLILLPIPLNRPSPRISTSHALHLAQLLFHIVQNVLQLVIFCPTLRQFFYFLLLFGNVKLLLFDLSTQLVHLASIVTFQLLIVFYLYNSTNGFGFLDFDQLLLHFLHFMFQYLVFFLQSGVMAVQIKVDLLILVSFFLPVFVVVGAIVVVTLLLSGFLPRFFIHLLTLCFYVMRLMCWVLQATSYTMVKTNDSSRCFDNISGIVDFVMFFRVIS